MVDEQEYHVNEEVESGEAGKSEEKQFKCYVCGKVFNSFQSLAGHMRIHKKERGMGVGELGETGGKGEGESAESTEAPVLPPPPEVEIINSAIEFLKERLPQIYGIEKYDKMIVNALKEDPRPLLNPNLLHSFIKSLCPRAHDSHLSVHVINPLYTRFPNLPQAVAKYLESTFHHQPYMYMNLYPPVPSPNPIYYPHIYPPIYNPHYALHYPYYYVPINPPYYPPPPRRVYKIVVDGQEIETDESGYMAWMRFLREREEYERRKQEHELSMKKLEIEIKKALESGGSRREEELSRKIDEISKKLEEERERRHQAELELIKRELDELKKRPSLLEELSIYEQIAKRLGFYRGGRTTIDLLESFVDRLDQRAAQLLSKLPVMSSEWKPEIRRTPEERARKAEEVVSRLEKAEEVMKAEERLIKAASRVKPRVVSSSGEEKQGVG